MSWDELLKDPSGPIAAEWPVDEVPNADQPQPAAQSGWEALLSGDTALDARPEGPAVPQVDGRTLNMREFGQLGDQVVSAEEALSSGLAQRFRDYLREQGALIQDPDEQRTFFEKNIEPLSRDIAEYDRMRKIALRDGVTLEAVFEAENPRTIGAFQAGPITFEGLTEEAVTRPFGTIGGALIRRGAQGLEQTASAALEQGARFLNTVDPDPRFQVDPRIFARDRQRGEQLQAALDKRADLEGILGKAGAEMFNGAAQTIPKMLAVGALGGAPLVYTVVMGERYNSALNEAEQAGIEGSNKLAYATTMAAWEGAMMYTMGKVGQKFGLTTLEEAASPALRSRAVQLLNQSGLRGKLARLFDKSATARFTAGTAIEGAEEGIIDAGNQALEFFAGTSDPENRGWERLAKATGTGILGGAGAKAVVGLADTASKLEARFRDNVAGVVAAEDALDRALARDLAALAGREAGAIGEPGTTPGDPGAPQGPTLPIREGLARAQQAAAQPGTPGFGARGAKKFFESATPEMIQQARQRGLSKSQFAEITGIRDTSADFRESFQETLDFYWPLVKSQQDATVQPPTPEAEPATTGETQAQPAPQDVPVPDSVVDPEAAAQPTGSETGAQTTTPPVRRRRSRTEQRLDTLAARLDAARQQIRDVRRAGRERLANRQQLITETVNLVQDALPPSARKESLMAQASRVRTVRAANKLAEKVEQEVERYDHELAKNELAEAKRSAANLRPEFANIVEDTLGGIDLGNDKTTKALAQLKRYYDENPDVPIPSGDRIALEKLSRTHVNNMSADEVRAAANTIKAAVHQNENAGKLLGEQRDRFIDTIATKIKVDAALARPQKLTTAPGDARGLLPFRSDDTDTNPRRQVGSIDSPAFREWAARPEDLMRFSPELRKLIYEDMFIQPNSEYLGRTRDTIINLQSAIEGAGMSTQGGVSAAGVSLLNTDFNRWRSEFTQVGRTRLSRDEALLIHLMMRDAELARDARNSGVRFDLRNRHVRVTPEVEQQLNAFLGEEGQAIADHMFRELNTTVIEPVNSAWETVNGIPLTKRQQHVPRPSGRSRQDQKKVDQKGFDERIVQETVDSYGHLQKRTGEPREIGVSETTTGAVDFYLNHADRMARVASYLVPYRNAKAVLARDDVRESIEKVGGPTLYDTIQSRVDQQVVPPRGRGTFERLVAQTQGNVKAARISLSIPAHILPLSGLMVSAAQQDGGMAALPMAMAKSSNPSDNARARRLIFEHSPMAWHRYRSGNYISEITAGVVGQKSVFRPSPVRNVFGKTMETAEFNIGGIPRWFLAESFVRRQGVDPGDPEFNSLVAREWERLMYRGENSSEPMELNGALAFAREHVVAAPMVAFMNSVSKVYSAGLRGMDLVRMGFDRELPARQRAVALAQGSAIVAPVAASLILEGILRELLSFEKIPGDYQQRIAKRVALNSATMLPVIGPVLELAARRAMDMRTFPSDSNLLIEAAGDVATAGGSLTNRFLEGDTSSQEWYSDMWRVAKAFEFAGIPVGGVEQIKRRANEGFFPGADRP